MTAIIKRKRKRKGKKREKEKEEREGKKKERRLRAPKIVAKFRVLGHPGLKTGLKGCSDRRTSTSKTSHKINTCYKTTRILDFYKCIAIILAFVGVLHQFCFDLA